MPNNGLCPHASHPFFPSYCVCGPVCDSSAESTLFTLCVNAPLLTTHCKLWTVKVAEVGCVLILEYLSKLELDWFYVLKTTNFVNVSERSWSEIIELVLFFNLETRDTQVLLSLQMSGHSALVIQGYWWLMMVIHVLFTYFIIEALIIMHYMLKRPYKVCHYSNS